MWHLPIPLTHGRNRIPSRSLASTPASSAALAAADLLSLSQTKWVINPRQLLTLWPQIIYVCVTIFVPNATIILFQHYLLFVFQFLGSYRNDSLKFCSQYLFSLTALWDLLKFNLPCAGPKLCWFVIWNMNVEKVSLIHTSWLYLLAYWWCT